MSIRIKILLLTFILLAFAVGSVAFINSRAFINDKNSYLYSVALERVSSEENKFQTDYRVLVDRLSIVFMSLDPDTRLFPEYIKSLAGQQKWGKIMLFSVDTNPPRLIDYIGDDYSVSQNLQQYLLSLQESKLVLNLSLKNPAKNPVYYRRGNLALYMETDLPAFSGLIQSNSWGAYSPNLKDFKFPQNITDNPQSRSAIEKLSKTSGGVKEIEIGDKSYLISMKEVPNTGLFVFQGFDKKVLFAPVKKAVTQTLVLSFVILVIGLSATLWGVNSVTSGIFLLSNSMNHFSKTGQSQKVNLQTNDEVGTMARVYNQMLDKIFALLAQEAQKARMESELNTAREVQKTLLPANKYENDFSTLKGFYKTASECGGDLWFAFQDEKVSFIFVGDATGHGVPAALITAATRAILALVAEERAFSPDTVLSRVNNVLCDVAKGAKMMTAFCCLYEHETRKLTYSNASHDCPFIVPRPPEDGKIKKNDLINLIDANSKRLGDVKDTKYTTETLDVPEGAALFIYSDGIIDAKSKDESVFGERSLIKSFVDISNKGNTRSLHDILTKKVVQFTEETEQPDDITFVTLYAPTTTE